MPAGTKVKASELVEKLESLDIDEGVRIESGRRKMFVNRRPSGIYVAQLDSDFCYLQTASQVTKLVRITFGKFSVWAY
jgi:hypothetical protein